MCIIDTGIGIELGILPDRCKQQNSGHQRENKNGSD